MSMLLTAFEVTHDIRISLCSHHISIMKPYTLCHPNFLQKSLFAAAQSFTIFVL